MNIIRWISFSPIGFVSFIIGMKIFPYILAWIYKIFYFIMFFGTKYDVAPFFDYEYAIEDFKAFIFTACLGTIIAGYVSGFIASQVVPKTNYPSVATAIYAIPMIGYLAILGIALWNTDHWFYSTCTELAFIITGFLSVVAMYSCTSSKEND